MLVGLHATLESFLHAAAPTDSLLRHATLDFSVPDAEFRDALAALTLSVYLYELRENLELRRAEPLIDRGTDPRRASRRRAPALLDCGYCITAWSPLERASRPVMEEHRLLGEVFSVLMRHSQIPREHWAPSIGAQMPPYPTVVAQPDALKNQAEFWTALGHPPKPVLTYVVTIAVPLHDPDDLGHTVGPTEASIQVEVDYMTPRHD